MSGESYTPLVGAIDDFRLWNRALSAEEIGAAGHRNAALQGTEEGLVVYLKLDPAAGELLADATGRGNDASIRHLWRTRRRWSRARSPSARRTSTASRSTRSGASTSTRSPTTAG
jgi:hypothetical protein